MGPFQRQHTRHPVDRLCRQAGLSCAVIFAMLAVLPSMAVATPWNKPVSMGIVTKASNNEPVEALLLLDDSEVQFKASQGLLRPTPDTYNQAMLEHRLRLDDLKARVKADIADPGLIILQDYPVLPVLHVRIANLQALDKIGRYGKILSVDENTRNEPFLAQSLPLIGQPTAWSAGYGGAGATVAVLDTGVDYTRTAFGSCTSPGVPSTTCRVVFSQDFAPADGALDDHGHGTNVAGIASGVAPSAKIAALDVFRTDGYAYTSDIIAAIDWCVANQANYNIAAINMSLGAGRYDSAVPPDDAWGVSIQKAVDVGIVVVAASGNNGYVESICLPAAYANVVSVGAVYDANLGPVGWSMCTDIVTSADKVTCFSNSASHLTMLAPGAIIEAAGIPMSGTSQAAPHVAGAVAVLHAAFPGDNVPQNVARLQAGPLVLDSRNGISKPRLDLAAVMEVVPPPPENQLLQFNATSKNVSESDTNVTLTLIRTGGMTGAVSVQYTTVDGTAKAGSDYTGQSGTLELADGVSTRDIVVPILNDTIIEGDEGFHVVLSNPAGASLGAVSSAAVTIADDDSSIAFETVNVVVGEGDGSVTLWVKRNGTFGGPASVKYATANGTAKAKTDYVATKGTLQWAAGESVAKGIVIPIVNNTVREKSEVFKVSLSSPVGAALGTDKTASVSISDDD